MSQGHVYVLTNEAMPGFVKIGLTQQDDVQSRVRALSNTAVPFPFEVYYSAWVPDCRKLEQTLHFVFGEKRAAKSREFFRIDPDLAKAIIELVQIQREAPPSDAEQDISSIDREIIETVKRERTEAFSFEKLGIPAGATLTFAKDPEITCTVSEGRSVIFRDEKMSLSAAALLVVREMGYDWTTVRGPAYWMRDGVKLSAIGAGPEI